VGSRQSGTEQLEEVYRQDPTLAKELEAYRKHALVAKIAEIGHEKRGAVVSCQVTSQAADTVQQRVSLEYELRYEENGQPQTMPLSITLLRPLRHDRYVQGWQVAPPASEGPGKEP
jgi:hypothetical protein